MKVITKKSIVPSDNLKMDLLKEKSDLKLTSGEINSTLNEIRNFKDEFSEEFNDYLDANEYYEYYSKIENIENKLISEQNKVNILNSKIDKSILENDKKLKEIEELNKEQQLKEQQEKNIKSQQGQNRNQNNLNQNPNQQRNQNINNPDMSVDEINTRYQMMFGNMEQEENLNRGRRF